MALTNDIFLYGPEDNPNDVRLGEPGIARGPLTIASTITASTESYAAEVLAEKFLATASASTETKAGVVLAESFSAAVTAAAETKAGVVLAEKFATVVQAATETSAGEVVAESESFVVTSATETGASVIVGVSNPLLTQQPSGGSRRPNGYEPIDLRRAKWRAAKRKLDAERKRLAELKRQQAKVEVQYRAITLTNDPPVLSQRLSDADHHLSDRARLLELEIKEYEQRVALQASRVKAARKESDQAKKEADRLADERELESAYERFLAEEEETIHAVRVERVRLEQEADDEMIQVLLMVHDE